MNKNERLAIALKHCNAIREELAFSLDWLQKEPIDTEWVANLSKDPFKKERISAFCARFGRFQDYLSDKVIKTWLDAVGEKVGVAFDNFSAAESAGILSIPSEQMLEMRSLRNRLIHEYIDEHENFACDLKAATVAATQLFETFANLQDYCRQHLNVGQ